MPYATVPFTHLALTLKAGDELPADHPMVALRPDLFTETPPPKSRRQPKE